MGQDWLRGAHPDRTSDLCSRTLWASLSLPQEEPCFLLYPLWEVPCLHMLGGGIFGQERCSLVGHWGAQRHFCLFGFLSSSLLYRLCPEPLAQLPRVYAASRPHKLVPRSWQLQPPTACGAVQGFAVTWGHDQAVLGVSFTSLVHKP